MRQVAVKLFLTTTAVALACFSTGSFGASSVVMSGNVVQVKDGDSIVLRVDDESYEVRVADIDAPEYDQAWGKQARNTLRRKVDKKTVEVAVLDIDNYGRLVAEVRHGGKSVGQQMVAEGHAWAYRDYLREEALLRIEANARAAGLGLWARPGAVAPWLFRRGERKATDLATLESNARPRSSVPQDRFANGFKCGSKTYCGEMRSCGEARFYLTHCGLTRLDGDGDSVPCERLCR